MCLFGNRSQMVPDVVRTQLVSLMFIPHFDVISDLFLNRPIEAWNLLVPSNEETKKNVGDKIHASVLRLIISKNQSKCKNK